MFFLKVKFLIGLVIFKAVVKGEGKLKGALIVGTPSLYNVSKPVTPTPVR